jgi:hypothetical protein
MKIRAAVSPMMNQMKTRVVFFAGVVVMAMGVISSAPAASAQKAESQVTIPFDFSANQKVLRAGHYRVVMDAENYVRLTSWETGESAGFAVHTTRSIKNSPANVLEFLHDGQGYELTSVRFGQGAVETQVALQSALERKTAKDATFTRTSISTR